MNLGYLFIGLGGALGAISRVALTRLLPSFILNIPLKILSVNILGCFILGLFTAVLSFYWQTSINMKHFLFQGFLGGFTTFSGFALEFGVLYEKGSYVLAIFYTILSVMLSILFFFGGLKIVRIFS